MITYTVNPGSYSFSEVVPTQWYLSAINCTGGNTTVNMPQRAVTINASAGETITCTFVNQRRVNIQARKYNDLNQDGLYNITEPFLPGWTIQLYDVSGTYITNKVTDGTGQVDFLLRPPGGYKICETPQVGWTNSTPGGLDPLLNVPCYTLLMPPGMGANILFGNYQETAVGRSAQERQLNVEYYWLADIDDPTTEGPDAQTNLRVFLPLVSR